MLSQDDKHFSLTNWLLKSGIRNIVLFSHELLHLIDNDYLIALSEHVVNPCLELPNPTDDFQRFVDFFNNEDVCCPNYLISK